MAAFDVYTGAIVCRLFVAQSLRPEVVAGSNRIRAIAHQLAEIYVRLFSACLLVPGPARAQNLLDRVGQPVHIFQHQAVELLFVRLSQFPPLQGFQMQPDGCHRRFQFVSHRIDKAVVLLAAPHFANQKDGVDHHPGNKQREKDDAEYQQHTFAPVEDDPADVERDRQCHQADAQDDEEDDSSAPARDAHGLWE